MSDNPYAALGVSKTASADAIKKAYKKIARESHPDLNPGDPAATARFKAAAAAHDLLKDPQKRGRFDRGEIDASGQEVPERRFYRDFAERPAATYNTSRGYQDFEDVSDVFADLFGRQAQAGRRASQEGVQMRGPDQRYLLDVGFLEAARGATRRITLPGGSTLDVRIPEGLADGQTIRLRGKGGEGLGGGPAGDALVTVSVESHPLFRREGADIHVELPIAIDEAVLGARVETPTIDGPVSLTVPKGATSGQMLRLRGRGVKHGEGRGDQLVSLKIVMPKTIDADLAEFMERWRTHSRYDPRAGMAT